MSWSGWGLQHIVHCLIFTLCTPQQPSSPPKHLHFTRLLQLHQNSIRDSKIHSVVRSTRESGPRHLAAWRASASCALPGTVPHHQIRSQLPAPSISGFTVAAYVTAHGQGIRWASGAPPVRATGPPLHPCSSPCMRAWLLQCCWGCGLRASEHCQASAAVQPAHGRSLNHYIGHVLVVLVRRRQIIAQLCNHLC